MEIFDDADELFLNDEVEIVNILNRQRRIYHSINRYVHVDNFDRWDNMDFIRRFRISKESVIEVLEQIGEQLEYPSHRNNPMTPLEQLLITLRFYATGSFYITIGDFAGIHKSTTCKIVNRVTRAISRLRPRYINLPNTEEQRRICKAKFYSIARFPQVLGAVDGTHIRIQSLGGENAEVFRNRKGYFSINVQAVSDASNFITDIVARWPGSAHDTNIFENSRVRMRLENGEMDPGVLLGDSGYPIRPYLITPLNNPITEGENRFNEAQIRTRNVIERTFGIWKRRFPVLSMGLRCRLQLIQHIIAASAIVHNIANRRNEYLPEEEVDMGEIQVDALPNNQNDHVRRDLIGYFENLNL